MTDRQTTKCSRCSHIHWSDEDHQCPTPQYDAARDRLVADAADADVTEDAETSPLIEYGSTSGEYFIPSHFDTLTRLARELVTHVPHATDWKIWYDAFHDYHRLEFRVDGHHFGVRYYKVFTLSRDYNEAYSGKYPTVNFGRSNRSLIQMFKFGRHKTWTHYDGSPIK